MSLQTEKLQIESKMAILLKERAGEELKVEMNIIAIRQEASPLFKPEEIEVEKLSMAVSELSKSITRIRQIDRDVAKYKRML